MTHFIGTVADAEGSLISLVITGPDGYRDTDSYSKSFDLPLNLKTGSYVATVTVAGHGKFKFSIAGDAINIMPSVPKDLSNSTKVFTFDIS